MEITDVTAYPINVPLVDLDDGGVAPYRTCHGELYDMDRVVVRVDTDEGVAGWGEVRAFLTPEVTATILEDGIGSMVQRQSPFELEALRRQLFIEYTNAQMFFAPIETACWDIVGKSLDEPIYRLLGGWTAPTQTSRKHRDHVNESQTDDRVDLAYALGIVSPEKARQVAVRVLEEGYTVLKMKAGRDWQEDVKRVRAIHDEVGDGLEYRLDPNQGWTLDEAVRVGTKLADDDIYLQYMEQPIRIDAHHSLARLAQRTQQPIGPNEDTYPPHNLRRLIDHGAVDVAVVDLTPAGGITGVRQLAGIAEDAGISLAHHCAFDLGVRTAAVLHAVHGIPGFDHPPDTVYYGWEEDILVNPFEVTEGSLPVPDGPGLGIEVDEGKLQQYHL
jgi:L-alanine-DL-glutamate epimerase-like enolase superfamily enzyme